MSLSAEPLFERDSITLSTGITGLSTDDPADLKGCQLHGGLLSIAGVQYTSSANTIDLIRFKRSDGLVFAMPSNFSELSKPETQQANMLVESGGTFFVRFSVCGSGGFMSLIDLYKLQ